MSEPTGDPDQPNSDLPNSHLPNSDRPKQSKLADRYRYKPMGVAYQGAMESVFAIAIGTTAGYWADDYFDTRPWLLAAGATIGFAAFVLRLTKLGAALNRATSSEESASGDSEASETAAPSENGARGASSDRFDRS